MEGYFIGEVDLFAGNFAPRQWAFCDGQLLAISSNEALFSILGTIYGGDGRTTFGLPDLRSRVAVGVGQGPGLRSYRIGSRGGSETDTITSATMPTHTHTASGKVKASNDPAQAGSSAAGQHFAEFTGAVYPDENGTIDDMMNGTASITIGNTGGSLGHNNVSPVLTLNYVICLFGPYPSRT